MAATCCTAGAGTCRRSFQKLEEIAILVVQSHKQRFHVIIQDTGIFCGNNVFGIQFGGDQYLLSTVHGDDATVITKIQRHAAIGSGNKCLAWRQCVSNAEFAQHAVFAARPGLAGNCRNGDCHISVLARNSIKEGAARRWSEGDELAALWRQTTPVLHTVLLYRWTVRASGDARKGWPAREGRYG